MVEFDAGAAPLLLELDAGAAPLLLLLELVVIGESVRPSSRLDFVRFVLFSAASLCCRRRHSASQLLFNPCSAVLRVRLSRPPLEQRHAPGRSRREAELLQGFACPPDLPAAPFIVLPLPLANTLLPSPPLPLPFLQQSLSAPSSRNCNICGRLICSSAKKSTLRMAPL